MTAFERHPLAGRRRSRTATAEKADPDAHALATLKTVAKNAENRDPESNDTALPFYVQTLSALSIYAQQDEHQQAYQQAYQMVARALQCDRSGNDNLQAERELLTDCPDPDQAKVNRSRFDIRNSLAIHTANSVGKLWSHHETSIKMTQAIYQPTGALPRSPQVSVGPGLSEPYHLIYRVPRTEEEPPAPYFYFHHFCDDKRHNSSVTTDRYLQDVFDSEICPACLAKVSEHEKLDDIMTMDIYHKQQDRWGKLPCMLRRYEEGAAELLKDKEVSVEETVEYGKQMIFDDLLSLWTQSRLWDKHPPGILDLDIDDRWKRATQATVWQFVEEEDQQSQQLWQWRWQNAYDKA